MSSPPSSPLSASTGVEENAGAGGVASGTGIESGIECGDTGSSPAPPASVWTRGADAGADAGGVAVGIDLGTTNSSVSVWLAAEARAKTIKCPETGGKTIKSAVCVDASCNVLAVGQAAVDEEASATAPRTLLSSTKRLMGRRFGDVSDAEKAACAFRIVGSSQGEDRALVAPAGAESRGTLEPEQVAAAVLSKLKGMAEAHLEKPVDRAVITVPAFFNGAQREATRRAGELAGLKVMRLLSEPVRVFLPAFLSLSFLSLPCLLAFFHSFVLAGLSCNSVSGF